MNEAIRTAAVKNHEAAKVDYLECERTYREAEKTLQRKRAALIAAEKDVENVHNGTPGTPGLPETKING